jgi:hypothetical protein
VAFDADVAVVQHTAGFPLVAVLGQVRAGVHAHRRPGGAHVVQPFERGFGHEFGLLGGLDLIHLRAGGGVALGGVGQRLLGGLVGTGQVHHLAAEPLDPAASVRLGVVQLVAPSCRRPGGTGEDQPAHHDNHYNHHDERGHDAST